MTERSPKRLPGAIECLADGMSIALARPWLLVVPIVLDVYFWLGWTLSLNSLTSPIQRWMLRQNEKEGQEVAKALEALGRTDSSQMLAAFTPSLLAGAPRHDVFAFADRAAFSPGSPLAALMVATALMVGACLVYSVFAMPLADAAVDRRRSPSGTFVAIARAWIRSMGLHLLFVASGLLLLGPILIVSVAMIFAGVNPASIVGATVFGFTVAAFLLWWFALKAIMVSDVGPLRAIRFSFLVVRAHFWQSIGLLGAWILIAVGLGQLWLEMAGNPAGLMTGVIANAFFAVGATIGGMLFYQGRISAAVPEHAMAGSSTPLGSAT